MEQTLILCFIQLPRGAGCRMLLSWAHQPLVAGCCCCCCCCFCWRIVLPDVCRCLLLAASGDVPANTRVYRLWKWYNSETGTTALHWLLRPQPKGKRAEEDSAEWSLQSSVWFCRLSLPSVSHVDVLLLFISTVSWLNNKKGKVFPYSLPSVGPGADPGVQAISPQVTWSESRLIISPNELSSLRLPGVCCLRVLCRPGFDLNWNCMLHSNSKTQNDIGFSFWFEIYKSSTSRFTVEMTYAVSNVVYFVCDHPDFFL